MFFFICLCEFLQFLVLLGKQSVIFVLVQDHHEINRNLNPELQAWRNSSGKQTADRHQISEQNMVIILWQG